MLAMLAKAALLADGAGIAAPTSARSAGAQASWVRLRASATASAREGTPSLARIAETW